jgi:selenocysteine-specific elongation factor
LALLPLTTPAGIHVGIVDVPGHERFVKNMLAGVGGIDLVLLVIAADEGVMPQTREHLAIVQLLGVRAASSCSPRAIWPSATGWTW